MRPVTPQPELTLTLVTLPIRSVLFCVLAKCCVFALLMTKARRLQTRNWLLSSNRFFKRIRGRGVSNCNSLHQKIADQEGKICVWENAPDSNIELTVFALGYGQPTNVTIHPDDQEHVITISRERR